MVKKANGSWRMCVDYTDLNKACPKDSFPLPRIDQLVDATSGHQMLSFMDAYSGYNQIRMNPMDEEATSFQTDKGLYCYQVMSFGLKNAGATYQRLMNKVFKNLLGRTMEVYVDDMLVKSLEASQHISHLEECFQLLRQYNLRLNPTKCAFGVTSGKFLGFMVTHRGIEANPEKIKALKEMVPPRNIKEVQRLNARIAALSRFLARSGDKYLPFFKILRGARNTGFQWTDDCQIAFEQLKTYLASPPLLSKPIQGEMLFIYLAISLNAISSVLVRIENTIKKPVYYVSKVLSDTESCYLMADKTALALVFLARRLRPYFQAHTIGVYTRLPLKAILQKPEASRRLVKWSVELGEFDIHYLPRPNIKSQVLADFVVECAVPTTDEPPSSLLQSPQWTLYVDGASGNSGAALVAGLTLVINCEVRNMIIYTDSQLVASQVEGEFDAHNSQLVQYLSLVRTLLAQIDTCQLVHILREHNTRVDALSKLATSTTGDLYKRRYIEEIHFPSIHGPWEILTIDDPRESSWMDPIISFLQDGTLPDDATTSIRIRRMADNFILIGDELYKKAFVGLYLKCLPPSEADYALREVRSGICGEHLGGRALDLKIMRQGFYWHTIKQDALEFAGGQWVEELHNVLWAYRTTSRTPTGETPYNLCFGTEAVIPVDIGIPNPRVKTFDSKSNEEKLRQQLDLLPEIRDVSHLRAASYRQRVARYFNRRVKPRPISVGDLVLRSIEAAGHGPQRNKLSPLWEGPYIVATMIKPGTFKLKDSDGKILPRTWNAENLRKYYQ
ncbi:uncharacterized protein LOC110032761 [Phalaenopsis equestris]|uniref:uncharacterized protein LOC110032761 n=1 Tax=Phalaenopsis equestris TaxID=78828 RepID=UPI0009E5FD90|nr:uncharacterized protein LOC110032761 [Phalaenopsis equestris]